MIDEPEAPAEEQDQPTDSAPDQGSAQEQAGSTDYFSENFDPQSLPDELQPAYKQMQGAWTRKTQELAEQRREAEAAQQFVSALNDPSTRDEALQYIFNELGEDAFASVAKQLGYDIEGQEDQEEDQQEFRDPRVDQLLEERQEQQYEQHLDALESQINDRITALDKESKLSLSDEEKEMIFVQALSLEPTEQGPDVDRAFKQYTGFISKRVNAYRESKRDVPAPPNSGTTGVPTAPVNDGKARRLRALEVANQALQSDS